MRYYIIAGEASGDLHASNLMRALKLCDKEADFRYFGGDLMQQQGGTLVKHYREMAYMGFIPVLMNLRTILNNMKVCQEDIRNYHPDVVILVDYPGFNLKIAKFVKTKLNLPVHYYISPKIWAWKQYRIHSFRKYVDHIYSILPFEQEFFHNLHYEVDYVGNPSVDSVCDYLQQKAIDRGTFLQMNHMEDRPLIALLPGSRRQEIRDNLPLMLKVAAQHSEYGLVIAGAPGIEPDYYKPYLGNCKATILFGQTYPLLQHSQFALVTSGTATLETALFRVPQVVCYAVVGGKLANWVFKHAFHVPYISLVNLIRGKEVVQELFGGRFTEEEVGRELHKLMTDKTYRQWMLDEYDEMIRILGEPGAATHTAQLIYNRLNN